MSQTRPRPRHVIFYKSLPKVELHRHLEGSLDFGTMLEVARSNKLDVPLSAAELHPLVQVTDGEPFTHTNFLSKFSTLRKFYCSEEVIKKFSRQSIAAAAADNIRYMELRFTPVALSRVHGFELPDVMDWVIESVTEAADAYGVKTRLIASMNRHESVELAEAVTRLAIERKDNCIVGIDLAGNEVDFPSEPFAPLFKEAKEAGMRITVHAGEWSGPQNVVEAIELLGAERIGHGVRVLEDPEAVKLALERKVTFEVCVTSNYQTGVFPSLKAHPLLQMIEAGLDVTINTDDPSVSQIELTDEYQLAVESLKLTLDQLREAMLDAARAAFLPEEERDELVAALEKEFREKNDAGA